MIRKKIAVEDFEKVAKENEFFIWHFFNPYLNLNLNSIYLPPNDFSPNGMPEILSMIKVPYFETDSEKAYDFLINLGNPFIENVYKLKVHNPVVVAFNRKRMVNHTFGPYCYCVEGIISLIGELNPQFILDTL
jgi:ABC-type transport system substrate-binding protein